jgi:methionyl-tRNA formyltransferase
LKNNIVNRQAIAPDMRILFAGTPEFAAGHLRALLDDSAHEIIAVFTQPDRPAGRGKRLTASPVKTLALLHHLPIYQPVSLREVATQEQISRLAPDIMVVVAYGLILPPAILAIPRLGCLNVHASLLPRWRGAAPIQRAIEAGDSQTGITIMQMDAGLDTGDMLLKTTCDIGEHDTTASLHDKLLDTGGSALCSVLEKIAEGSVSPEKQNSRDACYAAKISKSEAKIDWNLPSIVLERKVRAFIPFPVAYFDLDGQSVRVFESSALHESSQKIPGTIVQCSQQGIDISTGDNLLRLKKLQLPGGKPLSAGEILNGHSHHFSMGKVLL